MSGQQTYGPSIELTKLWAKTSAKTGLVYYVGRLSGARVTILPNRNKTDEPGNNHDMVVLLSQADATPKSGVQQPLPFNQKPPSRPDPEDTPPWDPQPAAKPYGRAYGARQPADRFKKRVGGGRTELVDDIVPFGAETR